MSERFFGVSNFFFLGLSFFWRSELTEGKSGLSFKDFGNDWFLVTDEVKFFLELDSLTT